MKTITILMFCILVTASCYADTISMTDEQFKNMDSLVSILKSKYPQFQGMSGSKDAMVVKGLSGEVVRDEMAALDYVSISTEQYEVDQELKRVREAMVDAAISTSDKTKTLKHKDKVRTALLQKAGF